MARSDVARRAGPFKAGARARIILRYVSFGDFTGGVSGSPIWPMFEKGQRAVFPLSPSKERSDRWSLIADEGINVTVPAIEREWRRADAPATPREFIVTELINALANGSPGEQFAASTYMRESFPPEAQRLLDAAMGNDEERWLAVAVSIASSLGIPRPSLAEIMSGATIRTRSAVRFQSSSHTHCRRARNASFQTG